MTRIATFRSLVFAATAAASLGSLTLTACTNDDVTEDGEYDDYITDGKADGGGLSEGSPTALAILKVVNEQSKTVLTKDVKLTSRAATNIITARNKAPIATLTALDAISYIGPVAFERLIDYVESHGLVGDGNPMAASAAITAWSGSFWGMLDGALARGWDSGSRQEWSEAQVRSFDACLSSYTTSCTNLIESMAGSKGTGLSPLMKFDYMVRLQLEAKYGRGGAGSTMYAHATKWELDNHYIGDNTAHRYWDSRGYAGKCIGWALSNFDYAEPTKNVTLDGVTFTPADIKGLLASIYNGAQFFIPENMVIGNEFHDYEGANTQENYDDVGPADFVRSLFATIGEGTLLEADLEPGDGVWNYPIHEYALTITSRSARKASVSAVIKYADDEVSYDMVASTNAARPDLLSRTLTFDLDLPTGWGDDLSLATGGRWTGGSVDTHPDVVIMGIEDGWRDTIYDYRNTDMNKEVNFPLLKRAQINGSAWTPIVDDLLARYYR